MSRFAIINGKRYELRVNNDETNSCELCDECGNVRVCMSGCIFLPKNVYLKKIAQPKSAQNTPSEARRKAGGK